MCSDEVRSSTDPTRRLGYPSSAVNKDRILEDKVVIVTGAGRGIGRAIALMCAQEGASVVVSDLGCDVSGEGSDPKVAADVVSEIRKTGGRAISDSRDVASRGAADAIVETAVQEFGRLDAVVSCAGIAADGTVLRMDDALIDRVLDVNLRSVFALVRAASQAMIDQKEGGAIVLFGGPSAFFGARGHAVVGAAAAGIVALTRSSALELRKHGIRVNAIAPTARTRQTEDLPTFQGIKESSMSPLHVAPLAVFLASPLAGEIHGEIVGIAGARAYAFRSRETTGSFSDGKPLSVHEVRDVWQDITRA